MTSPSEIPFKNVGNTIAQTVKELDALPGALERDFMWRRALVENITQGRVPQAQADSATKSLNERLRQLREFQTTLTRLNNSLKNLEPVIDKWQRQADKDAKTVLNSKAIVFDGGHQIYQAQRDALRLFAQKVGFALSDLDRLMQNLLLGRYAQDKDVKQILDRMKPVHRSISDSLKALDRDIQALHSQIPEPPRR